jgi:hypothetical protein
MLVASQVAYLHGEKTALEAFGLTKEALAPLAALAPVAMQGLRMAGTWAASKALPALARGAAGLGKNVASQMPSAIAQTGASMAADKMMQPRPASGPSTAPMPGMMGQGHLPGMAM